MKNRIFLDHNSSTPVCDEVREAILKVLTEGHGNPSSTHQEGQRARTWVEEARNAVAKLLHADPQEIYFTSGGTEANNLALYSRICPCGDNQRDKFVVATSPVEHPCILNPLRELQKENRIDLKYFHMDSRGNIDLNGAEEIIQSGVSLVTCMLINNEVGSIYPIQALAEICHRQPSPVPIHCDAIQAVGRVDVNPRNLGVDSLSLSGHKFYGPKGVGALWVADHGWLKPRIVGGGQEAGMRSGTENLPGIVGMGAACRYVQNHMAGWQKEIRALRDHLESELKNSVEGFSVNAEDSERIYSTANLHFSGVPGDMLQQALDIEGFAVGTGSACSSGTINASHVLLALGQDRKTASQSIRVSFGAKNTKEDVQAFLQALVRNIPRIREAL